MRAHCQTPLPDPAHDVAHLPISELGLVAAVFPALALGVIYASRPKAEFVPRLG